LVLFLSFILLYSTALCQILLHFAAKCTPFCRKLHSVLPQNALCFAANYQGVLRQNTAAFCRKTDCDEMLNNAIACIFSVKMLGGLP